MNTQDYYVQLTGWTEERAYWSQVAAWHGMFDDDIADIVREVKTAQLTLTHDFWDGDSFTERYFLGTVFAIMPSGKYYTPWACSNVDHVEAAQDTAFWDDLTRALESAGFWLENGEGDPCDLFVCRHFDADNYHLVSDLPDDPEGLIAFISDSQDSEALREYVTDDNECGAYFVLIQDGDYLAVWGIEGFVPYTHKHLYRVL